MEHAPPYKVSAKFKAKAPFPFDDLLDDLKGHVASNFLDLPTLLFLGMTSTTYRDLVHKTLKIKIKRTRLVEPLARSGSKPSIDFFFHDDFWNLVACEESFLEGLIRHARADLLRFFSIKGAGDFRQVDLAFDQITYSMPASRISFLLGQSKSSEFTKRFCDSLGLTLERRYYLNGCAYVGDSEAVVREIEKDGENIDWTDERPQSDDGSEFDPFSVLSCAIEGNSFHVVELMRSKLGVTFNYSEMDKPGAHYVPTTRVFFTDLQRGHSTESIEDGAILGALHYLDSIGADLSDPDIAYASFIGDSVSSMVFLMGKFGLFKGPRDPSNGSRRSFMKLSRIEDAYFQGRSKCLRYLLEHHSDQFDFDLSKLWEIILSKLFDRDHEWDMQASRVPADDLQLFTLLASKSKPRSDLISEHIPSNFFADVKGGVIGPELVQIFEFLRKEFVEIPPSIAPFLS